MSLITTPTQSHFESTQPIGVFDSGVGGLTVMRALIERLPFESILYVGDTARVPYGIKSVATIRHFTQQITQFLLEKRVKALIIACNTISAVAADIVQHLTTVPVLDVIDAGAAIAAQTTRNDIVAVLGTTTTVNSNAYARRIHQYRSSVRVISQACPLFVPLVEEGWLSHPVTRLTAKAYLAPILAQNPDTLVLGCTHYPLLTPLLRRLAGTQVQLVDSAVTVAERMAQMLQNQGQMAPATHTPNYHCCVTDLPLRFSTICERFLGRATPSIELIHWQD